MENYYQILMKRKGILKYSNEYKTEIRAQHLDILERVIPQGQIYTYSLKINGYVWWVKCTENHLTMLRLASTIPFNIYGETENVY